MNAFYDGEHRDARPLRTLETELSKERELACKASHRLERSTTRGAKNTAKAELWLANSKAEKLMDTLNSYHDKERFKAHAEDRLKRVVAVAERKTTEYLKRITNDKTQKEKQIISEKKEVEMRARLIVELRKNINPKNKIRATKRSNRSCRHCGGIAMFGADVCYTCNTK